MKWWRQKELFEQGYLDEPHSVQTKIEELKELPLWPLDINESERDLFYQKWTQELEQYGASTEVFQALTRLRNSQAQVVTTGQQAMIAGGPLLVYYKLRSTIQYAHKISTETGAQVYPLFWIAGDDSDLAEVNHFEILQSDRVFKFQDLQHQTGQPINQVRLESIHLDQWFHFVDSLSSEDLQNPEELKSYFRVGDTLVEAMARFLVKLFPEQTLLIIDGGGAAVRLCESQLLDRVYHEHDAIQDLLQKRSEKIAKWGVNTQVPLDSKKVRLFELQDNQRVRVELPYQVKAHYEWVHDALSRPLLVSLLFPVIGHVLGPAELKYFALIQDLFQWAQQKPPLVIKRFNGTLIRNQDQTWAKELGLGVDQMIQMKFSDWKNTLVENQYQELIQKLLEQDIKWPEYEMAEQDTSIQAAVSKTKARFQSKLDQMHQAWIVQVKKSIIQEDKQLLQRASSQSRWFGSGRIQERCLSWWEAEYLLSTPKVDWGDVYSEDHQMIQECP